eukprot:6486605-Amphidinium_carterae.1
MRNKSGRRKKEQCEALGFSPCKSLRLKRESKSRKVHHVRTLQDAAQTNDSSHAYMLVAPQSPQSMDGEHPWNLKSSHDGGCGAINCWGSKASALVWMDDAPMNASARKFCV